MAEELAQETFVRAYRSRENYLTGAECSTSLYRIAIAVAREHTCGKQSNLAAIRAELAAAAQTTFLPDRIVKIRQWVEQLPEQQRVAVMLHRYQGLNCGQIAEVLEVSEPAAKSLLFRAYYTLHQQLKALH
jgi:RNA polymerase sigma-70 factor (ECF subfamily)